jgi:acyl-CoA dehydrogenase
MGHRVTTILMNPSETRDRLVDGCYRTAEPGNQIGLMDAMLAEIILAEPVERRLQKAIRAGDITGESAEELFTNAILNGVINAEERELLEKTRAAVAEFIAVDEFETEELIAGHGYKSRNSKAVA